MNPTIAADPETAAAGGGELSPDVLQMARRLVREAQGRQIEPYLLNLRERSRYRFDKDKPPLLEGKYRTYVLARGTHSQVRPEERAAIDRVNAEGAKAQGSRYVPVEPQKTEFRPGDRVTPLSDNEALMMAQDPGKFRYQGPGATSDRPDLDELQAELERLRMESRQHAQVAEENAKLKTELEKARKRS